MDMMTRRRAMMGAASAPSGPLYQLHQGNNSRTGRNTIITGASIDDRNTGGTTGARNNYINAVSRSDSCPTASWFSLQAGDEVVLKIKNLSYTNNYTAGVAAYYVILKAASDVAIIRHNYSLPQGKSGTMQDVIETVTLGANIDATCVHFYAQRTSVVEYDLELWVNDVRYL